MLQGSDETRLGARANKLVVRAERHPNESPWGWLLRLSGLNDLPSPFKILDLASARRLSNDPKAYTRALAELTGSTDESISKITRGRSRFRFCYPDAEFPASAVDFLNPKVCSLCIKEKKLAYAAWDLSLWSSCPIHKIRLINRCGHCETPLRWRRSDIDRCGNPECKGLLSDGPFQPAHNAEISLISYFSGLTGHVCPTAAMPLIQNAHSPADAVRLAIGISALISPGSNFDLSRRIFDFLSRWPDSFRSLVASNYKYDAVQLDLAHRFPEIYRSLIPSAHVCTPPYFQQIFADEFQRTANELDHSANRPNFTVKQDVKWISRSEASRRLGVGTEEINALCDRGTLSAKSFLSKSGVFTYVAVSSADVEAIGGTRSAPPVKKRGWLRYSVSSEDVSRTIKLHRKYTSRLIQNWPEIDYIKYTRGLYITEASKQLILNLLGNAVLRTSPINRRYVAINNAMRFADVEVENIFQNILDRTLTVYRSNSSAINCQELYFVSDELRSIRNSISSQSAEVDSASAIEILNITYTELRRLIDGGYVHEVAKTKRGGRIICLHSVNEFKRNYIPTHVICKNTDLPMCIVERLLSARNIKPAIKKLSGRNTYDFWLADSLHPLILSQFRN